MKILAGDFDNPKVRDILRHHLEGMHANSPPGHVFALDWSALQQPEISFWTIWEGDDLLGCGALKDMGNGTGEIKSMRVWSHHQGKGAGRAMLGHIVTTARERGYSNLLLETGSGPAFEAALALYRKNGFTECGAFAAYEKSDFNQFMQRAL
jgi:putative acetyltransferase